MKNRKFTIPVSDSIGSVSAEVMGEDNMKLLYLFAHGAGAGMAHPFMIKVAKSLAEKDIGTIRFNFPYMEKGSKRPDVPAVAEKTILKVIEAAGRMFPGVPLIAGGKSFGGRMTSQALSKEPGTEVKGIVFFGFPLHAPGKPGTERASHLSAIRIPILFLQGTRDTLATIGLVEEVCGNLKGATLAKFEGADHSFKAGKADLTKPLVETVYSWCQQRFDI